MKVDKQKLRMKLQNIRDRIPEEKRMRMDARITEHIFSWELFQSAKKVFCFVSFRSEVNTIPLIEQSLKLEKTVSVPKVNPCTQSMDACIIENVTSSLEPGYYGILEPIKGCKILDSRSLDLIIAPGLAFTRRGERLGYGGGFYDRFMGCNDRAVRCALSYDQFILDELPVKEHDEPVDYVITESGVKPVVRKNHET
jgi:5-formyltetrahydrofolate cyclo-ligase